VIRRTFIAGTLVLLGVPIIAHARQGARVPRIGWLALGSPTPDTLATNETFLQELRHLGYVEGRNVSFEWRWAEGRAERLPRLASELVTLPVDVIVVGVTSAARAARQATATIPIVMTTVPDPVAAGLVQSLARPGANITGMSFMTPELAAKQLELLKETVPTVSRVGVLRDPAGPGHRITLAATEVAARALRLDLRVADIRSPGDFQPALAAFRRERVGAALVLAHPTFLAYRRQLIEAVNASHLPVLYATVEHAQAGGLMAYAASLAECYRRGAVFVDRILQGANPADLPVEQPTKFELVVNLRTAKALGLTIPASVLARADRVIQ
jgi:putative ABC transport system substrate-binding protein